MGNFSYKFPNHGEIEIDSVEYIWKIRRYWGIEGNAYGKPFGLLITVYNEKIMALYRKPWVVEFQLPAGEVNHSDEV